MREIRLVGCVLPDQSASSRLFLIRRRISQEWQLPGGEIGVGETLEHAAVRHLESKVGLRTSPDNIRLLGSLAVSQGEVRYNATMVALTRSVGDPVLVEWGLYDNEAHVNVLGFGAASHHLSPVVKTLGRLVNNETGAIAPWWENPVQ